MQHSRSLILMFTCIAPSSNYFVTATLCAAIADVGASIAEHCKRGIGHAAIPPQVVGVGSVCSPLVLPVHFPTQPVQQMLGPWPLGRATRRTQHDEAEALWVGVAFGEQEQCAILWVDFNVHTEAKVLMARTP